MENRLDFLEWLGPDMTTNVLMRLDDMADLVHMSSVSRSWRQFVIENGFCRRLCIWMFPELFRVKQVIEVSKSKKPIQVRTSTSSEGESLERDHRVYAHLAQSLTSSRKLKNCIETSVRASSTDSDSDESIENTLEPREKVEWMPSYWSSMGETDPDVPETLTYKLISQLCVVNEINIRPFRATFQLGHPIYSSKAVRFRMGYSKSSLDMKSIDKSVTGQRYNDDDSYTWTYISPIFPMVQENCLQTFKLPKPVICIGGILQIELLGRIQKQEMDDLYYICICHVEVIGRPLSPAFDVDILDSAEGNCVLKYSPNAQEGPSARNASQDDGAGSTGWRAIASRIRLVRDGRDWKRAVLLNALLGNFTSCTGNGSD